MKSAGTTAAWRALAAQTGLGEIRRVELIKTQNDLHRITTASGVVFCKTYTKPWYGAPGTDGYPVRHEAGAYATLKHHGLRTPEVIRADTTADNPLGRPYLLLRALEGRTIGQHRARGTDVAPLLEAVGRYLRAMHAIEFTYPGYVTSPQGPTAPPDPAEWRHGHWAAEVLEAAARERWQAHADAMGEPKHRRLLALLEENRAAFEAGYTPPRMLHGDCHVDQFFFHDGEVTGVVDLEVASSGAPIGDLVKFSIEASSKLSDLTWWRRLYRGYGTEPDFNLFKLRLCCAEYVEFRCQGWIGSYVEILRRLVAAKTWRELFACATETKRSRWRAGAADVR